MSISNRMAEEIFGRLARLERAAGLPPYDEKPKKKPKKRKLTWRQKGWYSHSQVFGPRSVDC